MTLSKELVMIDRVTHAYEGPLAVFLIGVRVHKP